jgi:hypothetical protein
VTRFRVRSASSPARNRLAERRSNGVVPLVRFPLAFWLALLTTACIDQPPLGPGEGASAKLGLIASVAGLTAGGDLWVEPIFTTPGEGAPDVLVSSPSRIDLTNNVTVQAITVDLGQCPDGCPISGILVLHDDVDPDVLGADTLDLGIVHQGDVLTPADTMHLTPSYRLTIVGGGEGTGSGTVEVAAIGGEAAVSCVVTDGQAADSGCVARYPLHTVVSLVPTVPRGVVFEAWSGDCEGTVPDARCELVMDGRRTAGARFGLAPTTGDLEVQISGLPDGVTALVTISGPGGFSAQLGASASLESLQPGDYTITAQPVSSGELTYTPEPASQRVTVVAGEPAAVAQVSYNPPTTGTLAVNIIGLPDGVTALVTAFGGSLPPNGQPFPTSDQAPSLEPGEYTVHALTVTDPNGQPYDPNIDPPQPVEVSAGHVTTVTVTYTAPPPAKLVFTVQPRGAASLAPITPPVTVEVRDDQDRLAPRFSGHITLSLQGGTPGATLRGPFSAIPERGVATFTGLTVDLAGSGYALAAAAPPLPTTVSDTFIITHGPLSPDRSTIEIASASLRTCCDTTTVTIVARDAAGNAISGATATLSATGDKNIVINPTAPTDGNGTARGRFGSRAVGTKTLSAQVNSIALARGATVSVRAGVVSSRLLLSGDLFENDIFVMNPDGSDTVNLTHDFADQFDPAFSPDGSKIAFEANGSIYVMNAEGSDTVNVTAGLGGRSSRPAWSPDNQSLAFGYDFCGECGDEIYVMGADGSNPVNVTGESGGTQPSWSPNGGRIAFVRETCGDGCVDDIWVMQRDGSKQVNLTGRLGGFNSAPAWSPDGLTIAFVREVCDTFCVDDLFTMSSADGSRVTNITNGGLGQIHSATWSPDGKQLLVDAECDSDVCNNSLILMDANGANPRRVGQGSDPDWR